MLDESFRAYLSVERARAATTLQQHCPNWTGESYPSWRQYPPLPDDAPEHAQHLLVAVMFFDAVLSQPALQEEFEFWTSSIRFVESWDEKEPLAEVGRRLKIYQPKLMREKKSRIAQERRKANRRIAEDALSKAGNPDDAAQLIGRSVRTLNRWLNG